jgi:hypothetical protein
MAWPSTAQAALCALAAGIGVLLVVIGALRMSARYNTPTDPAERPAPPIGHGAPALRIFVHPDALPTPDELEAWLAMPAVVPPHEQPPISPDPRRKEA